MVFDTVIIGAGLVGLATAYRLNQQHPDLRILVLDKESGPVQHQSGHNSGVIHSGIYYPPGGSRAILCRQGYREMVDFCQAHGITHDICGKIIVATHPEELPRLKAIYERGIANGLEGLELLSPQATLEKEPYATSTLQSIWVPQAGIADYPAVGRKYLELASAGGIEAVFDAKVIDIKKKPGAVTVVTTQGDFETKLVVNCGGLYADKITALTMPESHIQVLPFRGEYYLLRPERQYLVKNLIYPVPNPNFPFLGVHFTRMTRGSIEAGPNAVLAFKREGYSRRDFNWRELTETIRFSGFKRIAYKYWRDGLGELYRSYSKHAFVKALQRLMPEITAEDLLPGGAGVRAMACDPEGTLIDDFLFLEAENVINVGNAPSPAATASLAIGGTVAQKAATRLGI